MKRLIDLTGRQFGRLTVIKRVEGNIRHPQWLCKCECGNESIVFGTNLRRGTTASCGCLGREKAAEQMRINMSTHGKSSSRLYYVWIAMKNRCYRETDKAYENYGGRGIKICDEWLHDFKSFYDWAMANGYDENAPRGQCTLDRIDVNGNYCPKNCRWVDMKIQRNNRRKER